MNYKLNKLLLSVLIVGMSVLDGAAQRKICIDEDWQYRYGEQSLGEAMNRDWTKERTLDLPHDWSVETDAASAKGTHVGPFDPNGDYQKGFMVGGEAWYRKILECPERNDCRYELYFEGSYNQTTVYVNGEKLYFNHYGYSSFRVDITNVVAHAKDRTPLEVLVKVENKGNNTRWYSGSGIYRHVYLITTPKVCLDEWNSFVRTVSISEGSATIRVTADIFNYTTKNRKSTVEVAITDADGRNVGYASREATILPTSKGSADCDAVLRVDNPHLWTPETPYLYRAHLSVKTSDGRDELTIPFGIRTLSFSAREGFRLNGKERKMKGGCVHHDNGLLGAVSNDRADARRVELMKACGYDAVRTAHNLPSESFLHACDSLGMLVIDETFDQWFLSKNGEDYSRYFAEYYDREVQLMVRRDRNHPSVAMWSIGNEIPGRTKDNAVLAAEKMREYIYSLDSTRAVTAALCYWDDVAVDWHGEQSTRVTKSLDVIGYNYMYDTYEFDVKNHPERIICGTETYAKRASENWNLVEKYPQIIGDFVWTALDYLGEAGIGHSGDVRNGEGMPFFMPYPYFNGWCGDIDLIGQKKPQSYYRDVVWRQRNISMAVELPVPDGYHREISSWGWQPEYVDWTFPGYEGRNVTVNVYTRAPKVRLYLNGRLIGEQRTSETFWTGFGVTYQPGELKAVEVLASGKTGDSFVLKTTGAPHALRLNADRTAINADGRDLAYVTIELVDADGNVIRESGRKVNVTADSGATLICGNACPDDVRSFRSSTPSLFEGRALAIVRLPKMSDGDEHPFTLRVTSDGLPETSVTISPVADSTPEIHEPASATSPYSYDLLGRRTGKAHATGTIVICGGKKEFVTK